MFVTGVYGLAETIYFPLVTAGSLDFFSGAVDGGSDCLIIKDGGASAICVNDFAAEGNGWYSLQLTAEEMQADKILISIIDQTATKAFEDQAILIDTRLGPALMSYEGVELYTVNETNFSATTTSVEADRGLGRSEEATADHFLNRKLLFVAGAASGEMTTVTAYALANGRGKFTFAALKTTPAANDRFVIL